MLLVWLGTNLDTVGWAADPTPKPPAPKVVTDINVVPAFQEGQVKLTMPGRDGDAVYVDGWNAGTLPVQTDLAEGSHVFKVEGPTGTHEVSIYVTVSKDKVTTVDLTEPMAAPPPPPAPTATKR